MEHDTRASGLESLHHHCCARQGSVAAQRYLDGRSEPTQPVIVTLGYEKGGLSEIVLSRNSLHDGVGRKRSIGMTAAGLPANNRLVKAST